MAGIRSIAMLSAFAIFHVHDPEYFALGPMQMHRNNDRIEQIVHRRIARETKKIDISATVHLLADRAAISDQVYRYMKGHTHAFEISLQRSGHTAQNGYA